MDIDLLSKMVRETILDHDAVTLPGIGSFMAEIVPSMFTDKGYTIHPPYRRLFFSRREEGDTLLRDLYAESNDIPLASAERIVTEFLAEMKEVLKEKKTVVFPGLGRLRATKENNFFFVADEDLDIYPAGFGLKPVSLKTHQETEEEVSEMVAGLANILSEPVAEPVTPVAEPVAAVVTPVAPVAAPVTPAAEPSSESAVTPATPAAAPSAESAADPATPAAAPSAESAADPATPAAPPAESAATPATPAAPIAPAAPPAAPAATPSAEPVDPWAHLRKKEEPENWRAAREARRVARMEAMEKERETAGETVAEEAAPKRRPAWRRLLIALAVLAGVALLLLVAYVVVARLAPDFVDRFLYSAEELEFIREAYE